MDIRRIAKLNGEKEFLSIWENEKYGEKMREEILFNAVSNNNAEERYKIVKLLLDKGYEATWKNEENETVLHILLSRTQQNLEQTYQLCKAFIQKGVDINAVDCKKRLALQYLVNMKFSDEELEPLYNLWLSQNNVCLEKKNSWGYSPIDTARKMPYRKQFIEKIEGYIDIKFVTIKC